MSESSKRPYQQAEGEFLIDCRGEVWRIVRDGGMVARVTQQGEIESAGLHWLVDNFGPLDEFDPKCPACGGIGVVAIEATRGGTVDWVFDACPRECPSRVFAVKSSRPSGKGSQP